MKKCEKQIDGKHILKRMIITHDEFFNEYHRLVYRVPVYAEKCIACNKWLNIVPKNDQYDKT